MNKPYLTLLEGELLDEYSELSVSELCRACNLSAEKLIELVDYGVVEPKGRKFSHWRFSGMSIRRLQCALRLQQDLGVNVAGAALAIDLLEELSTLRQQLRRYQDFH
jgi:chaperone modulatory protein CbpM